ncbi:MAG TPA: hypothetical protein VKJ07_11505, partial [Mycobacteriales bacterium]|nr:hypothetical protein [Mycobacteriales bacterium]
GTFLYRAAFRYLVVNGGTTYRLVPGTAADALLMQAGPRVDFPAPFAASPAARTIAIQGAPGDVTVDVYTLSAEKLSDQSRAPRP